MSRMLSLHASGFAAATALAACGRRTDARHAFDTLLNRPTISVEEKVRTHLAAGELAASVERYRRARQHLRAAARLAPTNAAIHHQLGQAFENDPFGCDRRAAKRYRKACQLNANEPLYRASLGRAMIRIRELNSGVNLLRRVATEAPTNFAVLEIVAEGLREAGRSDLTFELLSRSRFVAPGNQQIEQLWVRAKYDLAIERQKSKQKQTAVHYNTTPVLKLRIESERMSSGDRTRCDGKNMPTPHIGRLRAYRTDLN
jgi:predicted Zn-dependent protease